MRDFMISMSIPAIYNRFSRKFGEMLKWFKYTPHQIVQLLKAILLIIMKKNQQKCLDLIEDTIKFLKLNYLNTFYSKKLLMKNYWSLYWRIFPSSSIISFSYNLLNNSLFLLFSSNSILFLSSSSPNFSISALKYINFFSSLIISLTA